MLWDSVEKMKMMMKMNGFVAGCFFVCSGLSVFAACETDEPTLESRVRLSAQRLEGEKYRPDKVFLTEAESGGWPGDTEGRTILALTLQEEALGVKAKYLDEILRRVPAHLNARGYMGPIYKDAFDEQQLSGNGWMLRGLCEYARRVQNPVIDAKGIAHRLARELFLPGVGHFKNYPIDAAARRGFAGQASGTIAETAGGWRLSTDIGCVFIGLDGLVQTWQLTGDDELKPAIEELIARFLEIDLLAIKAQTHASLTAMRALLRYDTARYLKDVERCFAIYREYGMTDRYENYNWFTRYDTWTEPCGIVDSLLLAHDLYAATGKEEYRELEGKIMTALCAHQRANGGFGLQKTFPKGCNHPPAEHRDEAHWCCTMRGGAGLARALLWARADVGTNRLVRSKATVREEAILLPTYGFSDPDPVPRTNEKRYPYFRYDGSTDQSERRTWKSVVLENSRVKVTMLPEIGGKVWGAVDKETGREFLYFNHVVKFRDIAMRGPWCSGGIEFNFGIMGHSPTTATPVDWTITTNQDGSVSCFVSATEYINRTTWQVEVRLGSDDDYFTTRTTWFNGSNLPQPYYQWMTAAYTARGNPRLYFPGDTQIGHDGDWHPWPIDEKGRDLSRYANNAFGGPKSYHVINGNNRMFAIWWPEAGFGSIHQNAVYDKYGRKIWLWALSREGGIWEDLLTDSDGQYVELQSGRVFHQARGTTFRTPFKHPTFLPGATDIFEEQWGVVRDEAKLIAKCNPTNFVHRPLEMPKDFDWNSMYGHYVRGEQAVRERDDALGEKELRECLKMEPNYAPALTVLASLQARRGRMAEVRELCTRALAINTYDPAANYLDGLAALAVGELKTAKERLGLASFSPEYRSPAYVLIAKAYMREAQWDEACAAADRALLANSSNPDAVLVQIASLRKMGRVKESEAVARRALEQWPLFHGARFELKLLGSLDRFRELIRTELPNQTFLEMGSWYEEAGLAEEALELFGFASLDPIAHIRSAALNARLARADVALSELAAAEKLPAGGAFPFRRESRDALLWAMERNSSWKFRYWAAVYLAATGEKEKALALLNSVTDANEDVFFLYRATLRTGEPRRSDLAAALKLKPSWRAYRDLATYLAESKDVKKTLDVATEAIARYPGKNPLQMSYARALVDTGRYAEAADYLATIKILPSEHKDNAHGIWVAAWKGIEAQARTKGDAVAAERARLRSEEYPENLGAGKPFPPEK